MCTKELMLLSMLIRFIWYRGYLFWAARGLSFFFLSYYLLSDYKLLRVELGEDDMHLKCILLSDFLSTWGYTQIAVLLNLYLVQKGYTPAIIGTGYSIAFLCGFMFALPAGIISDTYGYRSSLIAGAIVMTAAAWGQVVSANTSLLYLAYGSMGLSTSLFTASKTPLIKRLVSPDHLASKVALCRGMGSLAAVLGGLTSATVCSLASSMTLPLVSGAVLVTVGVVPLLALPRHSAFVRFAVHSLRKQGQFVRSRFMLSFVFFTLAIGLIRPFLNLVLAAKGLSMSATSLALTILRLASIVAWPVVLLLEKHNSVSFLIFVLIGLLGTGIGLVTITSIQLWLALLFFACVLAATAVSGYFRETARVSSGKGLSFAMLGMTYSLSAALGSLLGGMLFKSSENSLFRWVGVFLAVSLMFVLVEAWCKHKSTSLRRNRGLR